MKKGLILVLAALMLAGVSDRLCGDAPYYDGYSNVSTTRTAMSTAQTAMAVCITARLTTRLQRRGLQPEQARQAAEP